MSDTAPAATLAHVALVSHVVALLQAAPPVAQRVSRRFGRPVPEGIADAVGVAVGDSAGKALLCSGAPLDWTCLLDLSCAARADAGQAADEAVGALVVRVHRRLRSAESIAGLRAAGFELMPDLRLRPDDDDLAERIGAVNLSLSVRWRGADDDLSFIQT
ncbi:hypothetical protein [Leptothrix discophora]|uniref:Uncharacterized protein n=1 Tax=Leptothrix discophora TaxID=89 RepID=A0ABT9G1P5_LEPDI|nr:hypothetical protein [Leptothrix discophora]MDP4300345.1 hypothetical protein [Leptothrix discophora]